MRLRLAAACLFVVASAAPAVAEEQAFADHLLKQLSCTNDPDPTATLLYLNREKRIRLDDGEGMDSETCWAVEPAIEIQGVRFTHICGSAEDGLLIDLFPRFYWRGPGTSAGTGLRLITDLSEAALKAWAKEGLGDGPYHVRDAQFHEGKREISCNNLWRR
jgi:hypothetical protein